MIGTRWTLLGRLGTRLVPLRGRPLLLGGCDDARAVPCTLLGPRSPCRGLPSRHARQMYVAPTTHGATAAPQSLSVNPPQTYHATPHSTTRRHTSHPPPSPPYTHLFPLRAKGHLLLPSLSSPTLAHVRSPILTLSRPPLHRHHQYHSSTGPTLPSFHPHSSLDFLPPPYPIGSHSHRLRPLATSQRRSARSDLERAAGWAAVPLGAGGASPSSVHPHAHHRHVILSM